MFSQPQQRSFSTLSIVVKRKNVGETDRIVTLLTESQGKLVCVAKGARKMNSSKRALLEPGCLIKAFLIKTKSMPLLTQAELINDFTQAKQSLPQIRKLTQVLEIVDRLFTEGEEDSQLFSQVVEILTDLNRTRHSSSLIKEKLNSIITALGYQSLQDSQYSNYLDYVASLSERPMRSFEYLTIKA